MQPSLMPMTHLPEIRGRIQCRKLALDSIQREFPARVATKFALVSSASFQLWHPFTAL